MNGEWCAVQMESDGARVNDFVLGVTAPFNTFMTIISAQARFAWYTRRVNVNQLSCQI